uniref:Putative ovule protein n=1 Tax=Solanum chacoense TaxID=4108 RepID=A0A0V0HVY2_SOLCH
MLSYGGRSTPVKSVLYSMPIYLLTAIIPTTTTLKQIKCLITDFFWGLEKDKRKYHWASWETLSFLCEEGGIGIEESWWNFRSKKFLWGDFLKAKYCQKANPVIKNGTLDNPLVEEYDH